mmetsp:Transcript_7262/g.15860  ORF Transcript_7262/g.15860 Transcript_7262/m.15860 type:complete len:594 (-) Transcript_7262:76-1857(-)
MALSGLSPRAMAPPWSMGLSEEPMVPWMPKLLLPNLPPLGMQCSGPCGSGDAQPYGCLLGQDVLPGHMDSGAAFSGAFPSAPPLRACSGLAHRGAGFQGVSFQGPPAGHFWPGSGGPPHHAGRAQWPVQAEFSPRPQAMRRHRSVDAGRHWQTPVHVEVEEVETLSKRVSAVLQKCQSVLGSSRFVPDPRRDGLARSLEQAEGSYARMGQRWGQLQEELESARDFAHHVGMVSASGQRSQQRAGSRTARGLAYNDRGGLYQASAPRSSRERASRPSSAPPGSVPRPRPAGIETIEPGSSSCSRPGRAYQSPASAMSKYSAFTPSQPWQRAALARSGSQTERACRGLTPPQGLMVRPSPTPPLPAAWGASGLLASEPHAQRLASLAPSSPQGLEADEAPPEVAPELPRTAASCESGGAVTVVGAILDAAARPGPSGGADAIMAAIQATEAREAKGSTPQSPQRGEAPSADQHLTSEAASSPDKVMAGKSPSDVASPSGAALRSIGDERAAQLCVRGASENSSQASTSALEVQVEDHCAALEAQMMRMRENRAQRASVAKHSRLRSMERFMGGMGPVAGAQRISPFTPSSASEPS